jgi:pilus assembly protein CpaE
MTNNNLSVRIQTQSLFLREELEELILSIGGADIQGISDTGYCDLLILDMGSDPEKDFDYLNALQAAKLVGEIFLTSANTAPEILIQALRIGVKEFLPQPIKQEDVRGAFRKFIARRQPQQSVPEAARKKGQIISVIGSKGGVGTTTIAVNLATCFQNLEGVGSVAVVDMNPLFGDVSFFLGVDANGFDWLDVSKNIARVDETYLLSILLKHSSGVYILPPPTKLLQDAEAVGRAMTILFAKMQNLFDYVVVDIGNSLNVLSRIALKVSNGIMIAAQMNLPCLINIKRFREAMPDLGSLNDENILVVMNRYQKNAVVSLKEAEESLKKKVFWTLPNDYKTVFNAINQGKPLSSAAASTEIAKSFKAMASTMTRKKQKPEIKKTGLFTFDFLS